MPRSGSTGLLLGAVIVLLVVDAVIILEPWRSQAVSPTTVGPSVSLPFRQPLWRGAFPFRRVTPHFLLLASSEEFAMAEIEGVAEDAWALACRLLGVPVTPTRKLAVVLATDVTELFRLEHQLGLPYAGDVRRGNFTGGFYREIPMIALSGASPYYRENVAHEVAHWATFHVNPLCSRTVPRIVDEAIAEHIRHEIMTSRPPTHLAVLEPTMRSLVSQANIAELKLVEGVDTLSLRQLFDLGLFQFTSRRHYALAWCLGRVLFRLETERPRSLRTFLVAVDGNPWESFTIVYEGARVQELWREEMVALAKTG